MVEQIGRYQINHEAGRGGMSKVYEAFDPHFKRTVAVKVMTSELLDDPKLIARFEREAQTIAALEHPAIVPVYDFGEDEKRPYLVMRFMAGGTLADRLHNGPLSVAETAEILNRIGSALERAHEQGIIHRDLKPSNIMFDQYGDAFLADFGIARLTEGVETLTGENVIGTPAYMSPEQIHGDQTIDGRSDIYALGVICFEMLTGQRPYQETMPAKLMMQHLIDPVPDIREVNPDLPPGVEDVISRSMAKSPAERYTDAGELVDTLDSLAQIDPIQAQSKKKQAAATAAAAAAVSKPSGPSAAPEEVIEDIEVTIPDSGEISVPSIPSEAAPDSDSSPELVEQKKDGRNKWIVPVVIVSAILLIGITAVLFFGDTFSSEGGETAVDIESPAVEDAPASDADENEEAAAAVEPENVQTDDPQSAFEAQMERFYAAMDAEDFVSAETAINQAIDIMPEEAWLYMERAWLREMSGDLEGAMREIDQAIELDPQNGEYYAARGNVHRQLGEFTAALAHHQRAVELDPQNPFIQMELAETYYQLGELDTALEHMNEAIALRDDESWFFEGRANIYAEFGDYDLALNDLQRAAEIEPERRDFYTRAADMFLYQAEEPERALDMYNLAVEHSPDDAWVYADRALAYEALGDIEAVLDDINQAIELDPHNSNFFIQRGLIYLYQLEDEDAALADLNTAVEVDPQNPDAYAERANFYQTYAGDLEAALEDRNEAAALDPEGPWRYADRFHVYRELGRDDEALADLDHCLQLDPDYYWCSWERAWFYDSMDQKSEAVVDFQHFLESAPEDDCPECHEDAARYVQENS